jgi:capsular polysaccharide biosynthesis protein
VKAVVWERAALPQSPVSPDPVRTGVIALVVGLMLGTGLAFLVDRLDRRWRSPDEVEQVSGVLTLGVIPEFKRPKNKKVED